MENETLRKVIFIIDTIAFSLLSIIVFGMYYKNATLDDWCINIIILIPILTFLIRSINNGSIAPFFVSFALEGVVCGLLYFIDTRFPGFGDSFWGYFFILAGFYIICLLGIFIDDSGSGDIGIGGCNCNDDCHCDFCNAKDG